MRLLFAPRIPVAFADSLRLMNKLLGWLKLWQKIVVIICTFALPLAVLGVFVFKGYQKDISFAQLEKCGNEYQHPLEELLELLPQHQALLGRYLGGDKETRSELT